MARHFFLAVLKEAWRFRLLSAEQLTVDGILFEAWASMKSFRLRECADRPRAVVATPPWTFAGNSAALVPMAPLRTPEVRLARKGSGREAKLCFAGHALMENKDGPAVDVVPGQGHDSPIWRNESGPGWTAGPPDTLDTTGARRSARASRRPSGWVKTLGGERKLRYKGVARSQL